MSEHANSHQYLTNHEALSSRNSELEGLKMASVYQTSIHYRISISSQLQKDEIYKEIGLDTLLSLSLVTVKQGLRTDAG